MQSRTLGRIPMRRLVLAFAAALVLGGGSAQAFYWYDWPGSRTRPPDTLVPGGEPPGGFEPPPGGGPDEPEPPQEPSAPEPSTVVAGLMGLAFVGASRLRRKLLQK